MEHEQVERQVARKSAMIYLPIAIGGALLFLLAASLVGSYPTVARVGGTVWVGLLSLRPEPQAQVLPGRNLYVYHIHYDESSHAQVVQSTVHYHNQIGERVCRCN